MHCDEAFLFIWIKALSINYLIVKEEEIQYSIINYIYDINFIKKFFVTHFRNLNEIKEILKKTYTDEDLERKISINSSEKEYSNINNNTYNNYNGYNNINIETIEKCIYTIFELYSFPRNSTKFLIKNIFED